MNVSSFLSIYWNNVWSIFYDNFKHLQENNMDNKKTFIKHSCIL